MSSTTRTVRNVLSIDGCGFRGRMQLLVLDELMKQHSGNTEQPSRPCDVFDLICGTATGGLIAILLGRLGMTCGEAIKAYDDLESAIFNPSNKKPRPTLEVILTHSGPFNTSGFRARLEAIIQQHAGDSKAPMLAKEIDKMPAKKCKTFVTVVSGSTAYDADPYRIRSYFKKDDASPTPGTSWTILDAALGTKSCPNHFSPHDVGGGTFMGANRSGFSNPSMIAYLEALSVFGRDAELTLISLGMGLTRTLDYAELSEEDVRKMILNLNLQITDEETLRRLGRLINHTHLVAIGTQIKHLRLNVLIDQNPKQKYMRLEPTRDEHVPFILVDYAQEETIVTAGKKFFQEDGEKLRSAVDFVQRVESKWIELQGYTCDSTSIVERKPSVDMSKMKPKQIMRQCLLWEEETKKNTKKDQYISCFAVTTTKTTQSVKMVTGAIYPVDDDDSTLFVRVLLNDQWRFFPQRRAPEGKWDGDEDAPARDPIQAIQKWQGDSSIKAFRSDDWYTKSDVKPDQVNIYEFSFSLPYHGTWVRTGTT